MSNTATRQRTGNLRLLLTGLAVSALVVIAAIALYAFTRGQSTPRRTAQPSTELAGRPHEIIANSGLYFLGTSSYSGSASYALRSDAGIIVVDPGFSFAELEAAFESAQLDVTAVKIILITHQHADHWFASRELIERSGAKVMAHAKEIPNLTTAADLRQYYAWHAPQIDTIPVLAEVRGLNDGDQVQLGGQTIHVVATPGHTHGSVCYRAQVGGQHVLWSGDTVLAVTNDSVGGDYMTRMGPEFGGSMRDYRASLNRLQSIPVDIVLPGHPQYGSSLNSQIGPAGWQTLLQPAIDRLGRWLSGFEREASVFLDNVPKVIAPNLLYLGERNETACYVLTTSEGAICVDPGDRSPSELSDAIRQVTPDDVRLKLVLLTADHPNHSSAAAALCTATGAELIAGSASSHDSDYESRVSVHDGAVLSCGDLNLTVLDSGRRDGTMAYLTRLAGYDVLISGDTMARFPLGLNEYVHTDAPEPDAAAQRRFFRSLKQCKIDIVLPAHPRCHESPYYLPGEWSQRTRDW